MSGLSDATWDWILMFVKASKAFVEFCTRRNRAGKSLARHRQFMRRDGRVIVADCLFHLNWAHFAWAKVPFEVKTGQPHAVVLD